MKQVIASTKLIAQRPGEAEFDLEIKIGAPYQIAPDEWACPLAFDPWDDEIRDVHGSSSFQALCLASSLALELLRGFKEKGGVLFIAPGLDFPLEAYSIEATLRMWGGANIR